MQKTGCVLSAVTLQMAISVQFVVRASQAVPAVGTVLIAEAYKAVISADNNTIKTIITDSNRAIALRVFFFINRPPNNILYHNITSLIYHFMAAYRKRALFSSACRNHYPNNLSSVMAKSLYFLPSYASVITNLYLFPV